jgi:ribosomal protein L33
MAWAKNKIILTNTSIVTLPDGTTKKFYHRYVIRKSKGKGKPVGKLTLMKYNPLPQVRRHVPYVEVKYK